MRLSWRLKSVGRIGGRRLGMVWFWSNNCVNKVSLLDRLQSYFAALPLALHLIINTTWLTCCAGACLRRWPSAEARLCAQACKRRK